MTSVTLIEDERQFDSLLKHELPLVVEFTASWCGPCRLVSPSINELAGDCGDRVQVCRIDVDVNAAVAERLDVEILPTVMLFRQGQIVKTLVGVKCEKDCVRELKDAL